LLSVTIIGCQKKTQSEAKEPSLQQEEVQQEEPEVVAIKSILSRDAEISDQVRRLKSNGVPERIALKQTLDDIRAIDLSEAPRDFRLAYYDHYKAWQDYIRALSAEKNQAPDIGKALTATFGIYRIANGDFTGLAALGESSDSGAPSRSKQALNKIYESWSSVERMAVKYGAPLAAPKTSGSPETVSITKVVLADRRWDTALFSDPAPEAIFRVYVDNDLTCFLEADNEYTLTPTCEISAEPSSQVKIEVFDEDNGEMESAGQWRGSGADLKIRGERITLQDVQIELRKYPSQ